MILVLVLGRFAGKKIERLVGREMGTWWSQVKGPVLLLGQDSEHGISICKGTIQAVLRLMFLVICLFSEEKETGH